MILAIDDNKDLLSIICQMLKLSGYDCIGVNNGEEGIKKAKELNPRIILSDIGMEGMTGYDVARYIRSNENLKDIYMISISGYSSGRDIESSKEAGFDMHLAKPIDFNSLKDIIQKLEVDI